MPPSASNPIASARNFVARTQTSQALLLECLSDSLKNESAVNTLQTRTSRLGRHNDFYETDIPTHRPRRRMAFAARRKDPVKTGQIDWRFGRQGCQPDNENHRLKDHLGCAGPAQRLQLVADVVVRSEQQMLSRNSWPADLPTKPFGILVFVHPRRYARGERIRLSLPPDHQMAHCAPGVGGNASQLSQRDRLSET